MKNKRHYSIVKYIICDLSGERCGEDYPIDVRLNPDCENCDYYKRKC